MKEDNNKENDDYKFLNDSKNLSYIDELIENELINDIINAKKNEIYENIVFEGRKRYYIEDLSERDYTLENTTPYKIEILNCTIVEHSWVNLLCKVAELLLDIFPNYVNKILEIRCPWSKVEMFTLTPRTNYKLIKHNLYINCNHTALHCCWFLQDMFDFFEIDKSNIKLLIHRPPSAEPKKIQEYIEKKFKNEFTDYIFINYQKDSSYANNVLKVVDKYLNPTLSKISKSYTNLYLFDDNLVLTNYAKKLRENINYSNLYTVKGKRILNKALDYVIEFYKCSK